MLVKRAIQGTLEDYKTRLREGLNTNARFPLEAYMRPFFNSRIVKQTFYLYSSQILGMVLGVVTVTLNTRILGPERYGIVSFFFTIVEYVVLFFRFGFFSSGGLLIAQENAEEKGREIIGALILIGSIIGLGFGGFIFSTSFFIDTLFKTNTKHIFRIFSPLLVVVPFQMLISQIATGTNKIGILASFNIIPKILYVIGVVVFLLFEFGNLSADMVIFMNLSSVAIGVVLIVRAFNPSFRNLRENLKKIWEKNKEYGLHLYLGQITDKSTYKLDGIFISYLVNTVQLGFYNLATTLASPIVLLSQSLSTSLFKDFAHKEKMPKKVIYPNFLWLAVCTPGLIVCGGYIVSSLFGDKFRGMNYLIPPLALTCFFQGMYQPYNMFLAAKGKGTWLRNISIAQSIFNVIGNILFIYYMGALGAAIASMIAALIAYLGYIYYYYKLY